MFLVAGELRSQRDALPGAASLDELALLAHTAGAEVVGRTIQRLDRPQPATYIGRGKIDEIVSQRGSVGYSAVIFDDELSPSQQRNLENVLGVKVLDRTALILDIFARRARTREARLQVELAQTEYLLPRLAGQWSHLERLEGRIGTRGPGETQIETDRRLVRNRIAKLKREIDDVGRQRRLQRRKRGRQGIAIAALVGYTNAGKSTLMQALSGAEVLTEDLLFATLDPVTRKAKLPEASELLLTDTVGFIQKLPTQLVTSFRATLEELDEADVLVHVVDITHENAADQYATVESTLAELHLAEKPRVLALNKVDRLVPNLEATLSLGDLRDGFDDKMQPTVLTSAAKRWNLERLLETVDAQVHGRVEISRETRLPRAAAL